ncbi:unnamed protein product [Rotaria sordida]|uniref:N-acetyltransferase domain-containing protein n=1 Tax=Rotaria sordida TaxID=392033 RepID=A0A814S825_9BILA|nr:unnamed protein product [Rotaria sordida]CAF1172312.1 unnamed protein product [Rotaria sordida]CAF1173693.1 unnamed protein product [Rotaria sordida]CAF1428004.1 unnamed protein product [Rotaria sordida]CAF1429982.1 unnamed protein product [Rotaria sordida]
MNTSVTPSIIIRSYQPSDLSACQALMLDGHKEYDNGMAYYMHVFQTDMADIEKNYLQVPNAHWWVAVSTDDNRIVGQVAVQPLRLGSPIYYETLPLEERDHICELRRMSVVPDVQRHGIGFRLLVTLLDFARQHGYRQVHLTTLASMSKACAFYQKHGFVQGEIHRVSNDESNLEKPTQHKEHVWKSLSNRFIFKPGDIIPEEDQQRMKLPPTQSKYEYLQHFFLTL